MEPIGCPMASIALEDTMPERIRRRRMAAGLVMISGVLASCSSGPSSVTDNAASCVSPTLTASRASVRAGGSIAVTGHWFVRECHDVVSNGQLVPPNASIRAVALILTTRSGQLFTLAEVHPDNAGSFTTNVKIPRAADSGPATLSSQDVLGKNALGTDAKITIRP